MANTPFTLTVTGNRGNTSIKEINLRSGPNTSYEVMAKVPVGTANLLVLDVSADDKNTLQQNKLYQWLKVALANGTVGWLRDDLVDVVGDGSRFGYGVVTQLKNGFTLTRSIAPVGQVAPTPAQPATSLPAATPAQPAAAPVSTPQPAAPAAPASDLDRVRKAAFNITAAFEGGGYATYQSYDSGIISYGRFQFTLAAGSFITVISRYIERSNSEVAGRLKGYMPRLNAKDEGLRKDPELKALCQEAAKDPIMQAIQDEVATEGFWQPVIDLSVKPRNIQSALGYALLFDMSIQHGRFNFLVPKTEEVLGVPNKSVLGRNGITEETFITKLAQLRQENLYALAAKLNLPGMKVRGDFWVKLVASGDWDLQGDADGNLDVKGKIRQVRNP